ncbi:MAG: glycosyltransferase [Clostridiales bacterium]|nr:glycosyltransferase [Clostridiales bacterium]
MPPLVSICCVTYNHAGTIAETLEGFLAQQADVSVEILVHDDASDDGTEAILRDYAQRYPDVVKPLFETENQYRKGTAMDATFNFPRVTGAYIALCEGDDLWVDPHKLRRQIDCLNAHPGCTFCFTNGTVRDGGGRIPDRPFIPFYPEEAAHYAPETREYDLGALTRLTFIPTASFLFPREALTRIPRDLLLAPCPTGDLRLKLLLTAAGRAVYLHAFTCVYRQNAASSVMARWGAEPPAKTRERCRQVIAMLENVDAFSHRRWHADVRRLMDVQLRVWIEAAPTHALLASPDARRVLRSMPPARRLKARLKATLPEALFRRIRAWFRRNSPSASR